MLVLPDADLDLAADAAVNAGFGAAGERCMAVSVLVAVDTIADELVAKIKQRMATLNVGPGWAPASEMGPLVTSAHRDKVTSYLDAGVADGAELVVDGRHHPVSVQTPDVQSTRAGFWLGPALFDHVQPGMSVYTDEIGEDGVRFFTRGKAVT